MSRDTASANALWRDKLETRVPGRVSWYGKCADGGKYLETEVDSTINIFVVSSVILQIIIIFYTNGKTDICFVFRHLSYGSSIDYYRFFFLSKWNGYFSAFSEHWIFFRPSDFPGGCYRLSPIEWKNKPYGGGTFDSCGVSVRLPGWLFIACIF